MSPQMIQTLIDAGPWAVLGLLIWFLYRQVDRGRWVHYQVIEQYEKRLKEKDDVIRRQDAIIKGAGGITDTTLGLLERDMVRSRDAGPGNA